jgi:Leucine-rich repeat (LRR) protein
MCPAHILQTSYDPSRLEKSPKLKPYVKFLKTLECNPSLESLPEDFFNDLIALEAFSANRSKLLELPHGLDKCTHLTKLEFSGTNLTTLPQDMSQLKGRLLHLNISKTKITTIPDVVFELVSLKTLIADNLLLESLSESLQNLSDLVHLSVKGARLSTLPKAVAKLKKLEKLELAGVPWLEIKPGHFVTKELFLEYLESINEDSKKFLELSKEGQNTVSIPVCFANYRIFEIF